MGRKQTLSASWSRMSSCSPIGLLRSSRSIHPPLRSASCLVAPYISVRQLNQGVGIGPTAGVGSAPSLASKCLLRYPRSNALMLRYREGIHILGSTDSTWYAVCASSAYDRYVPMGCGQARYSHNSNNNHEKEDSIFQEIQTGSCTSHQYVA